jgi:hypothetical protein
MPSKQRTGHTQPFPVGARSAARRARRNPHPGDAPAPLATQRTGASAESAVPLQPAIIGQTKSVTTPGFHAHQRVEPDELVEAAEPGGGRSGAEERNDPLRLGDAAALDLPHASARPQTVRRTACPPATACVRGGLRAAHSA